MINSVVYVALWASVALNFYAGVVRLRNARRQEQQLKDAPPIRKTKQHNLRMPQQSTALQRLLANVPQVTAEQVNDGELLRLASMQGFRD